MATNVGNKKGEILISILTQSKGILDLQRLVNGLMDTCDNAQQEYPQLLYMIKIVALKMVPQNSMFFSPGGLAYVFVSIYGTLCDN